MAEGTTNIETSEAGAPTVHFDKTADNASKRPPAQRIFLSGCNSLIGHSLFEELRNDHIAIHDESQVAHKFFGTLNRNDEETPAPSASVKLLDSKKKPRNFKK